MRKVVFLLLLIALSDLVKAQNTEIDYPEIGKPCPEFVLQNIQYYSKKKASLKDFHGKWLLLDFWNKSCGACIASFPRLSQMQKELGDKLQIMLVGNEDREKKIEYIYSRYRAKGNLLMPCAFDSAAVARFGYGIVLPRSILIDDKGIVQCLTSSLHMDEMKAFISGKNPVIPRTYRDDEEVPQEANHTIPFKYEKPFAIHDNGAIDTDFLFRSILTSWKPGINKSSSVGSIKTVLEKVNPQAFFILGADLKMLYFYAFIGSEYVGESDYGKYYNKLILEVSDSSRFEYNNRTGKNLFCYSLNLPQSEGNVERVKEIMQRDLQNYFGFDVSLETRKFPCWSLVTTVAGREKLKTRGGPQIIKGSHNLYFKGKNFPFIDIFQMVKGLNDDNIIFDETGITGNVDVDLDCKDCVLTDINDLKKALQANGLDLIKTEREMKAIVVRDTKQH